MTIKIDDTFDVEFLAKMDGSHLLELKIGDLSKDNYHSVVITPENWENLRKFFINEYFIQKKPTTSNEKCTLPNDFEKRCELFFQGFEALGYIYAVLKENGLSNDQIDPSIMAIRQALMIKGQ